MLDFGASPSAADNRVAIQTAIDDLTVAELYLPPGVFDVTVDPSATGLAGVFGAASVALKPRSNLRIFGPGTIRLKTGQGGSSGAIIGNWSGVAIANFVLEDITLDGNRTNTTGTISGSVLVDATECGYTNVKVQHITYNGLQMRRFAGFDGSSIYGVSNCWARYCKVSDILGIGVQFNRASGLWIDDNVIYSIGDNAIDVEGNNTVGGGIGQRISIRGNVCHTTTNCVFLESAGDAIVTGNTFQNFSSNGVILNAINSAALEVIIANNRFKDGAGVTGITVNNNSGKVFIGGNSFKTLTNSIFANGSALGLTVGVNMHEAIAEVLVRVPTTVSSLIRSCIDRQTYIGARSSGKPFTMSPVSNTDNSPTRVYAVIAAPTVYLEDGSVAATLADEYKDGITGTLDLNGGWGAYSIYSSFYNPAGETLVTENASTMVVGRYVTINGTLFKVSAARTGTEFAVQSSAGVDGNYTTTTNGVYAWVQYWPEWMTT